MKCLDDCHLYDLESMKGEHRSSIQFYKMVSPDDWIDGVTNEEVLRVLIHRLHYLNEEWMGGKFKCIENDIAIDSLRMALEQLEKRTSDRIARKVEGTYEI